MIAIVERERHACARRREDELHRRENSWTITNLCDSNARSGLGEESAFA